MKSPVLQYLLLLMYGSCCWMVVGGQACQPNCKFGHHWT